MPRTTEPEAVHPRGPTTYDLVERIQQEALDPGYRASTARGDAAPASLNSRSMTGVVLAVFAVLLVTAGLQTYRNAPLQASDRQSLIDQITAEKARLSQLQTRAARLQATVSSLTAESLQSTQSGRGVDQQLSILGMEAGTYPVSGPGLKVTVDDAPDTSGAGGVVLDRDLQVLVNALWASGAEAVAINNQRITPLTAIRSAGGAITVNYRSLSRPYVVKAIGNPDTLTVRFTRSRGGQQWLALQNTYGLRFEIATATSVALPAAAVPTLRVAQQLEVTQ